ncbi:MAG: hypothetical protein NTV31_16920 [Bacteroidia bacterium]|nr:hypothetical protein [Bacteroidia bacterium]
MKLLITSVGSLLGQNILDCIESRRHLITVIGIDAAAENPRNFRCDTVYLVHTTDNNFFLNDFTAVIEKENPDFILPGRDGDSIFLSDLKSNNPGLFEKKIPFGNSFIPRIVLDKYQTYLFCQKNNLPFANSFLFSSEKDIPELNEFIHKHGFPLVVKPREGYGSHGIYFVLNHNQLFESARDGELLIQEYLGNGDDIFKYNNQFKRGIPLFFQVPEKEQYAAQTIISPDGSLGEVFITINTMVIGRAEHIKQIENRDIKNIVYAYSKVFYQNGWYGTINFQLKPDKNGNWKVFELNSRLTGTSSARALLGYDEFGILANLFIPEFKIPDLSRPEKVQGQVVKYLHDNLLFDKRVDQLNSNKVWKKS